MPDITESPPDRLHALLSRPSARRAFLGWSGVSLVGLIVGCGGGNDEKADTTQTTADDGAAVVLDFSDAFGVLNYAYALEQLEAAYYTQVIDKPYDGMSNDEADLFKDIKAHEIAHREFLKALLADKAIGGLTPNFTEVDFADRDSVFQTALTFENLGVSAYIGAASLIDVSGPLGTVPLEAAGDIVAVEARHASVIGSVIEENRGSMFAPEAFDDAMAPDQVLKAAGPFIKTQIRAENL
jgi:hypothetical protein